MSTLLWRTAFGVAFALQCLALYLPRPPSGPSGFPLDKVVHVAMFAIVAALGVRIGVALRWLVILLGSQAVLSELLQWWAIPGRSAEVADLLADAAGIALGVWLGRTWLRRVQPAQ